MNAIQDPVQKKGPRSKTLQQELHNLHIERGLIRTPSASTLSGSVSLILSSNSVHIPIFVYRNILSSK